MKNRYEGLLVLNVKGNEESAREIVEKLEGEFKKEGADLEQVQKIGNRHFTYVAGHSDSGYYVNFIFQGEPTIIERLRSRFRLNSDIYRQYFQKLPVPRPQKVRKVKVKA
jgi:small subunit ribosomal protein S6